MTGRALAVAVLLLFCASRSRAEVHYLILSGSGGEAVYDEQFMDRATRLRKAIGAMTDTPESLVRLLSAQSDTHPLNLEALKTEISSLAGALGTNDDLILVLIGHGSHIRGESKFQIPGPDLEARALGEMLATIPAGRIVVINTTASSAGFINDLSGPGRIICTATKSAGERNATMFSEYLTVAIEEGSADRNRDERVSLAEWIQQADALTQAFYTGENLIASEHALLDDNGDGLGTRVADLVAVRAEEPAGAKPDADGAKPDSPAPSQRDGLTASAIFIRDFEFPKTAPQELVRKYLDLLDKIEELKSRKPDMPESEYNRNLEKLLTEAAKTHREIRSYFTKDS